MSIEKKYYTFIKDQRGFAMTSTTMFIFIVISIFAIYLTRFALTSQKSSAYLIQDIRARNLVQTGLDIGLVKTDEGNYGQLLQGISGSLNHGNYLVTINESSDELNNSLYAHHSMLVGQATIGEVQKKARLILSAYPNAFNLAAFGKNVNGSSSFSMSSSSIDGDVYFNGNTGSVSVNQGHYVYNENGVSGVQSLDSDLDFPNLDLSYFDILLDNAPNVESNSTTNSSTTITYDFEDGNQGWTEHVVSWRETWGRRTTNGRGNSFGTGHALGTINNGRVYGAEHSYVMSPVFDATGGGTISFNYWANNEGGNWDREYLEISYNGGSSWATLINYTDGRWSNSWSKKSTSVNISSVKGNSNTRIRFRFNTVDGCCGNNLSFFVDNVTVPSSAPEFVDHGDLDGLTINLGVNQSIGEGPTIQNGVMTFTNKITFTNCTILGPGKIINKESIHFINSTLGGNVEIVTEDSLIIKGSSSILGSGVFGMSQSVVAYSEDYFGMDDGEFNGIVFSNSPKTEIKNSAQFNGALVSLSSNVDIINNSQVNGSVISNYGINLTNSTITKGDLTPVFTNNYGIKPQVLPGSYKEF